MVGTLSQDINHPIHLCLSRARGLSRPSVHIHRPPYLTTWAVASSANPTQPNPQFPAPFVRDSAIPVRSVGRHAVVAMFIVLHEEVLVQAVARKDHRRNAEAGEGVLEPVEAAEAAGVAPRLTVSCQVQS
jgi:hypothetical protein